MASKSQSGRLFERFPELGCFPVAVRRIAFEKDITMKQAIEGSHLSASAFFALVPGDAGKRGRIPSLASFLAIADGLGVSPEALLREMRSEARTRKKMENK